MRAESEGTAYPSPLRDRVILFMWQALFRLVSCPLDAAVMAYYLIGQVHYNLREFAAAESIFKASLAVLQQLATCAIFCLLNSKP